MNSQHIDNVSRRIFETHVPVRNLGRAMKFYDEIMALQLGHVDDERRIALYWVGDWGTSMLGLWEKPEPEVHHQHYAMEVSLDQLTPSIRRLGNFGVKTKDFFGKETQTPTVLAWMPAVSIYFDDPDGHLLEYISILPGEPRPDLGIFPWEDRFEKGLPREI